MCYPDFPFPNYRESYLSAEKVLKYLHDYADHFYIRKKIKVLPSLNVHIPPSLNVFVFCIAVQSVGERSQANCDS
jgi:cation diffusion facilitator CzcD-associated flavoprotein CzcO